LAGRNRQAIIRRATIRRAICWCNPERSRKTKMKRIVIGAAAALALATASALAAEPAVIYDLGGKNDKSFNEAAFRGAEQFKKEMKAKYREFEIQNDAQREQALRKFARDGNDPIIAIGF